MVVKKGKIPRLAVENLLVMCEMYSREQGRPASEIFLEFLGLMDRYSEYFFSGGWPKKYDHKEATSFTDEDEEFLFDGVDEEFYGRYITVCLKKNMYLDGFMGYFGMYWTKKAYHNRYIRPFYEPVLEEFRVLAENKDAKLVLGALRKEFDAKLIHDSLIDLLEHVYPDKPTMKLIDDLFDLLHTNEKLPPCGHSRCHWYYKQKYSQ